MKPSDLKSILANPATSAVIHAALHALIAQEETSIDSWGHNASEVHSVDSDRELSIASSQRLIKAAKALQRKLK